MDNFFDRLKEAKLFEGIQESDLRSMLDCLSAEKKQFQKGAFILSAGDRTVYLALVLSGRVIVLKEDYWGNANIVTEIGPGQTFAESYACVGNVPLAVSVQAEEDSEILYLNIRRVLTVCSSGCAFHQRLIRNLVSMLASKNLFLNEKMTHLTQRSTREKLLSYLTSESARQGSRKFEIPYNRQELADYLSVDRSAMSSELGKMKRDGLIDFRKNQFVLKEGKTV